MIYQEKEQIPKYGTLVYYSFCTDNLGKKYQQWMVPIRILGITPAEYVKLLTEEFNAIVRYSPEHGFLGRHWESQVDCARWRKYINEAAKAKGFHI